MALCSWLILLALPGPAPPAAEQKAMLAGITEKALTYVERLPDFICTQVTRRSVDNTGSGKRWRDLDVIEEELSYAARKENYKVLTVNGAPSNLSHNQIRGYRSSGEFGTLLYRVFDPGSETKFGWHGWGMADGRRTCVFRYRAARDRSKMAVTVGRRRIIVGFHGLVHADAETHAVLRIEVTQEIPRGFPLDSGTLDLRYAFIPISGQEYVLPVRAELQSRYKKNLLKNEIEFSRYHKYGAEATVTFGDARPD